jgi:vitamin-K-epoxide reductase (warfarin-sensitive)
MNTIQVIAGIGIFLSIYAHYISRKARHKDYRALCDISERISCTKAFTSKYAKLLGIPNALLGLLYYAAVFVLTTGGFVSILFWLSIFGVLASLVLAYISFFKLKNFCLVCTTTYLLNICILILAIIQ